MKLKIWYILSIALTITYFILGISYLVLPRSHVLAYLALIIATIASAGIISFTMKNYKAAKTLFIISGILGLPIGVLLIVFAVLIDKLPDED
jgi:hypothetical protein